MSESQPARKHPTYLSLAKSCREGDNRLATPRDALRGCLDEVEAGELDPEMLLILIATKPSQEGDRNFTWRTAGVDYFSTIALLERFKAWFVASWMGLGPD